jgi:hypothetical protein
MKVNVSKETFPTPIRIGLSSLFSCQRLFILKMQVLLQCNSLATAANDQFSSSYLNRSEMWHLKKIVSIIFLTLVSNFDILGRL